MKNSKNKTKSLFLFAFIAGLLFFSSLNAQETKFRIESWRYGINRAMQWNATALGWQNLHVTDNNFHSAKDNIDYVDGTGNGFMVVITDKSGNKTEENYLFKLTKDTELKNASRYLMIFGYNQSNAVLEYEAKIRSEIVPGINEGNTVIIHGHTDNIGTETGNKKLSFERANQAKFIIDDQLKKDNKKVNVNAIGTGQNKTPYTFDNRYPEGRMYNRYVFVEVIQ